MKLNKQVEMYFNLAVEKGLQHVEMYFNLAVEKGLQHVEELARETLRKNPKGLKEFTMAMGSYFFTDKDGDIVDVEKKSPKLEAFLCEWDEYLKLSGIPMRFTATGPKITDW